MHTYKCLFTCVGIHVYVQVHAHSCVHTHTDTHAHMDGHVPVYLYTLEGGTGFIFKPVFGSKNRYKNRLTISDEAPLV